MIRIGAIWDSTVQVFAGRGATIARVVLLTMIAPVLLFAALTIGLGAGAGTGSRVIGLALRLVLLFGLLAITALASHPAIGEREGYRLAARAWLPAVGAVLLIAVALVLLMIPGAALLVASGLDVELARAGLPQPTLATGPLLGASLYFVVYAGFLLWLAARLAPLLAVLVNERRGVGAIRRAFAMTRGLALRMVAVELLFLIVLVVADRAATWVVGVILRLLIDPDRQVLIAVLGLLPRALLLLAMWVLAAVFAARLYATIRAERAGEPALS